MSWGISENASEKEKLKAEINDFLCGLNSTCAIDFVAYHKLYDAVMPIIDEMYERRDQLNEITLPEFKGQLVDTLEDFLEEKGVTPNMLPNTEREKDEEGAIIYGWHYDMVGDNIEHELRVHDLVGGKNPCTSQVAADTVNHIFEAYQEIMDMIEPAFKLNDDDERRLKQEIRQVFVNWGIFA